VNELDFSSRFVRASHRPRGLARCVALLLAVAPSLVRAQSVDTVGAPALVFSPSRYAQSAADAPSTVTVLTADEIWRFGYRTLDEVLGAVRGMFTTNDRQFSYVNVRGVHRSGDFNTRVLLLVDGRRTNFMHDDVSAIGTDALIDVEMIERVEVMHGPGSSLYGTNAFYGVINIITRRGAALAGAVARADLLSGNAARATVAYGTQRPNGLDVALFASGARSRGGDLRYPDLAGPALPDGVVRGLDDDASARMLATVRAGNFHLLGALANRHKGVPTGSYETTPGDPRTESRERIGLLSVQYERAFTDLSRLWATASVVDGREVGDYAYDDGVLTEHLASRTAMLEGQYLRFVGAGHTITMGGEYRGTMSERLEVTQTNLVDPIVDLRPSSRVLAGFLQADLRLHDAVGLSVGVRHDRYDGTLSATSPRLALRWTLGARSVLKAGYGTAFRAPNSYELFYSDGGITQLPPANGLAPERMRNSELSLEHTFGRRLQGSLTAYDARVRGLIGAATEPGSDVFRFTNLYRQKSRGVEATMLARPGRGVVLQGNVALQQARDLETDVVLVNAPRAVARAAATIPLAADRVQLLGEYRHLGVRRTLDDATVPRLHQTSVGIRLRPRLASGPELHLMVWNVLDQAQLDPAGEEHVQDVLARDGRAFRAALRWAF
jgi:iron complex outermembrane receptor protein